MSFAITGLIISSAMGAVVTWMLAPRPRSNWAALLHICLAVEVGMALCTITRLGAMVLFHATGRPLLGLDLSLLLGLLVLSAVTARSGPSRDFGLVDDSRESGGRPIAIFRALLAVLLICAAIAGADAFITLSAARPHGNWDAWAMWNMKARFFYLGGANWSLALGEEVAGVRPDYPLFLPLAVARLWAFAGSDTTAIPRMLAALFTGLVVLILFASVGRVRGFSAAALAGLVLLGSKVLVEEGASQYADIALSAFMLAAIVVASAAAEAGHGMNRLWALAGFLAGCAAWTKNEGQLFCAALCISGTLVLARRHGLRNAAKRFAVFLLGATPALLCVFSMKLAFAWRNDVFEEQTFVGAVRHLIEPDRYQVFWDEFAKLVPQSIDKWLLIILSLYVAVSFLADWRRGRRTVEGMRIAAFSLALMAGGYAVIYLITPHDLHWHMSTSLARLVLHLWPSALFVVFASIPALDELSLGSRNQVGGAQPA